ncbi:hypothetical protein ACCD04_30060, partial [Telluria sp. Tellsp131]
TSVKVGYRQASYMQKPVQLILSGLFCISAVHNGYQIQPRKRKFSHRHRKNCSVDTILKPGGVKLP